MKPRGPAPFKLFWVSTPDQFDDGFVVARTGLAARKFVADGEKDWALAEKICVLSPDFQNPEAVFHFVEEDPPSAGWASPRLLAACGIEIIHKTSPRVFVRGRRLFTEGIYEWMRDRVQEDAELRARTEHSVGPSPGRHAPRTCPKND